MTSHIRHSSCSHDDLDVVERTTNVGLTLIVDGKYEFADLDELIVSHVHAMSRRIEELMNHEKFKKDDEELRESRDPSKH